MHLRTILVGLFALAFGISAAAGVYLLGIQAPKSLESGTTEIVVVTDDVPRGASLTSEMISLRPWPTDHLPTGALTRPEDAIDRTVWIPLVADDPVTDNKLAEKGAGRGLAALIPRGMRAVTILTPNVSTGVAGFILPGYKVDVLLTLSRVGQNDRTGGGGTITLLQNIEILAVDQRIDAPSENRVDPKDLRSVTLLVTPEEATRLDLGQNKGTLGLTLRNPEDATTTEMQPATLAGLLLNPGDSSHDRDMELATDGLFKNAEFTSTEVENDAVAPSTASAPVNDNEQSASRELQSGSQPVLPPIRTLRGSSSGLVHLESPPSLVR